MWKNKSGLIDSRLVIASDEPDIKVRLECHIFGWLIIMFVEYSFLKITEWC